jgi:hypothetical protein
MNMSQSWEQTRSFCHTRESGYPGISSFQIFFWIPASAGMTITGRKMTFSAAC